MNIEPQRFVITIKKVDAFPDTPTPKGAYAFVRDWSMDFLARRLAVVLGAEVMTDDGMYAPDISGLPPTPPPGPSEGAQA